MTKKELEKDIRTLSREVRRLSKENFNLKAYLQLILGSSSNTEEVDFILTSKKEKQK